MPGSDGAVQKGWAVKKQKETANALELVVHNKKRYQHPPFWRKAMPSVAAGGCRHSPYRPCGTGWHPGTGGRNQKGLEG